MCRKNGSICAAAARGADRQYAAAIAAWLDRAYPALVALEPTGGYERPLLAALRQRGVPAMRVHPNRLVAFRRSRGILAKTDRVDAALILAFAADLLTRQGCAAGIAERDGLRELAARRRQLTEVLHAERCRLDLAALGRRAAQSGGDHRRAAPQPGRDRARDRPAIADDPQLAELNRLLQTIFGIGPVVPPP